MASVTLAVDTWTGGDDPDIEGRTPDGDPSGGTPGLDVGTWAHMDDPFAVAAQIAIKSGAAVATPFAAWRVTYVLEGVTGLGADQSAAAVGRFVALTGNTHGVGVVVRGDATDAGSGYWFTLYNDGDWTLGSAVATLATGTHAALVAGEDVRLQVCAVGPVVTAYINSALVACAVDNTHATGAPGLGLVDESGSGTDPRVSRFEAGTGCGVPGSVSSVLSVHKNLADRPVTDLHIYANQSWRQVQEAWVYRNLAWRPLFSRTNGYELSDHCGQRQVGEPIYSLVIPTGTDYVYGPDGATVAALQTELSTGTVASRLAVHPGAIMAAPDMDDYFGNYVPSHFGMYTPGAGGLNQLKDALFATVVGISTPADVYGVTAPPRYHTLTTSVPPLGCLGELDEHTHLWSDPAMLGLDADFDIQGGRFTSTGELTGDPSGTKWQFNAWGVRCDGASNPVASTVFTKAVSDDPADDGGAQNGFPGQLPRTGMSSSNNGGTVIPDAKYVANYFSIQVFEESPGVYRHRVRYGVIYSVPEGCGIAKLDWLNNQVGTTADYNYYPCATLTDTAPSSGLTAPAAVEWWEPHHEIYATQRDGGDVYVLDPDDGTLVATIAAVDTGLSQGRGMCYDTRTEDRVFAVGGGVVCCIDRAGRSVDWTVSGRGTSLHSVIYVEGATAADDTLWVSDEAEGVVRVLSAVDGALLHTVAVGSEPHDLAAAMAGAYQGMVYVCNTGSDTVSVVDPATMTVARTIDVRDGPWGIVWDASREVFWVGHVTSQVVIAVI